MEKLEGRRTAPPRRADDGWQFAFRIVGERVEQVGTRVEKLERLVEKLCFLLRVLAWICGGILSTVGTLAAVWQAWA